MFKIIFIIIILILVGLGIYFWFKSPIKTTLENPTIQNLGKILGFSKETPSNNTRSSNDNNLIDQTKNSFEENAKKGIETAKTIVYNEAKTTIDNVFDKQTDNSQPVTVNVLGVTNTDPNQQLYVIDFSKDNDLKLNLIVNNKYYLKFQNIPANYCIYINGDKYPISDGVIEIQFAKIGNYPIKTNRCDLNDKNIGTVTVK